MAAEETRLEADRRKALGHGRDGKRDAKDEDVEECGEALNVFDEQDRDDHHDGYCAICAVMSLAGTLLVSGPAILLIPDAYQVLNRTTDAEFFHLATPHGISQPRAPPAS